MTYFNTSKSFYALFNLGYRAFIQPAPIKNVHPSITQGKGFIYTK